MGRRWDDPPLPWTRHCRHEEPTPPDTDEGRKNTIRITEFASARLRVINRGYRSVISVNRKPQFRITAVICKVYRGVPCSLDFLLGFSSKWLSRSENRLFRCRFKLSIIASACLSSLQMLTIMSPIPLPFPWSSLLNSANLTGKSAGKADDKLMEMHTISVWRRMNRRVGSFLPEYSHSRFRFRILSDPTSEAARSYR